MPDRRTFLKTLVAAPVLATLAPWRASPGVYLRQGDAIRFIQHYVVNPSPCRADLIFGFSGVQRSVVVGVDEGTDA